MHFKISSDEWVIALTNRECQNSLILKMFSLTIGLLCQICKDSTVGLKKKLYPSELSFQNNMDHLILIFLWFMVIFLLKRCTVKLCTKVEFFPSNCNFLKIVHKLKDGIRAPYFEANCINKHRFKKK